MKKTIFDIMNKKWNEKATDEFRHIVINENIENNYKDYTEGIDFENKTIIDYGCGGGYLGKFLFEKGIKKYIGYDICDNSIEAAKENLKEQNARFYKLKDFDFTRYKADILISFECIQHFPTKIYLDKWLNVLNNSNYKELLLQYRFGKLTFTDQNVMTWMCKLPPKYIENKLKNYEVVHRNKKEIGNIKKEWIYFKRNSNNLKKIIKDIEKTRPKLIGTSELFINNNVKD